MPPLPAGITLFRGLADGAVLLPLIAAVAAEAPFRTMRTPGGQAMSAAMTNCGPLGWVTDRQGYRYAAADPLTGRPWPAMPEAFRALAVDAAARSGFPGFDPDAGLINRYAPGARMGAHQDRDEADFRWPIVSVSLGLTARFDFIGERRSGPPALSLTLTHGDVVVFGGPARLWFHAIKPIKDGAHPQAGAFRYNMTFRRAR